MIQPLTTEQFIQKAIIIHGNKYDYSKVIYINNRVKVCIICPIHGEFWQTPSSHNSGRGCKKCQYVKLHQDRVKTLEQFIKDAKEVHGDKYDYTIFIYVNNHTLGKIICPDHGIFEQTPTNHICDKNGCPKCNSSLGENSIELWLISNNFKYILQKRFKDCKDKRVLPFDFYLLDYNLIIEYDGPQHFEVIRFNGMSQKKAELLFKITKLHDKIKNKYCKNNNIPLLRIPYWDFKNINNILENYLK